METLPFRSGKRDIPDIYSCVHPVWIQPWKPLVDFGRLVDSGSVRRMHFPLSTLELEAVWVSSLGPDVGRGEH